MARNKTQIGEKYNAPFPTALRRLMDERGETQENIARAAEKTRQTVSQYVNGISEPGYETLVKIANYFDVSIDFLLGRTEDPDRHPCAADELGLSAKAIQGIKQHHDHGSPSNIQGLNALLEHGHLIGLAGEIDRFIQRTAEMIEISDFYKSRHEHNGDTDSDYYKFVLSYSEATLVTELERLIESNHPKFKGQYQIIIGSNMVEHQRRCILDAFDDILRSVSNYNDFKSGTLQREDFLK